MAKHLRQKKKSEKVKVKEEQDSTDSSIQSNLSSPRHIPDVLYAEDGSTFYPCKHCCRAFANKPDLDKHDSICSTGGRSTPSPFAKQGASNKENLTDEEFNNNEEEFLTPRRMTRARTTDSASPKSTVGNNKRKAVARKLEPVDKRICGVPAQGETNIITTGMVSENINNLSEATKKAVLENINKLLSNSSISIIAEKDSPIIVQTAGSDLHPALQISSRNLNENCVQITTVKTNGPKGPQEKLPDISEILESNFGISKPPVRPDNLSDTEDEEEIDVKSTISKYQKAINHDYLLDGASECSEIILDDAEFEGTIVLEDLDIHICKQCGSVYHTLEDLVNHDKYEHRKMRKRYPPGELEKFNLQFKSSKSNLCPICNKLLRTKTAWPRHMQSHSIVLNYECRICLKKFTRNDHRKLHEKRHVVPMRSSSDDEQ